MGLRGILLCFDDVLSPKRLELPQIECVIHVRPGFASLCRKRRHADVLRLMQSKKLIGSAIIAYLQKKGVCLTAHTKHSHWVDSKSRLATLVQLLRIFSIEVPLRAPCPVSARRLSGGCAALCRG